MPRVGKGRPRKRPERVLGDKAYTGQPCRQELGRRGIACLIPTRTNERSARKKKGRKGGRPFGFEAEVYKQRNVVERCIRRLKRFRRVATRYDKRASNYLAFVTFASILLWIRT